MSATNNATGSHHCHRAEDIDASISVASVRRGTWDRAAPVLSGAPVSSPAAPVLSRYVDGCCAAAGAAFGLDGADGAAGAAGAELAGAAGGAGAAVIAGRLAS